MYENSFQALRNLALAVLPTRNWYAENSSKITRRKQLVGNNSSKLKGEKLVEN